MTVNLKTNINNKLKNMTGDNYINEHRTETFHKGDKVVMHTCIESTISEYKGKIWTCQTDSFLSGGKQEVVFLNGFSGYFATDFLQIVDMPNQTSIF